VTTPTAPAACSVFPALSGRLVVRGQCSGNGQRGAGNNPADLSLELKAIEVVVVFFRMFSP